MTENPLVTTFWGFSHLTPHKSSPLIGCQLWPHRASTRPACSGSRRRNWAREARRRPSAYSAAHAPTRPPPACRDRGRPERPPPNSDLSSQPGKGNADRVRIEDIWVTQKKTRHTSAMCTHYQRGDKTYLFYTVNRVVKLRLTWAWLMMDFIFVSGYICNFFNEVFEKKTNILSLNLVYQRAVTSRYNEAELSTVKNKLVSSLWWKNITVTLSKLHYTWILKILCCDLLLFISLRMCQNIKQ